MKTSDFHSLPAGSVQLEEYQYVIRYAAYTSACPFHPGFQIAMSGDIFRPA